MSAQELGCRFFHRLTQIPQLSGRLSRCCCVNQRRWMSGQSNRDYQVNPEFVNRNSRNLERMGLARKRTGWTYQYPTKEYYNKLMFEVTNRHTTGFIEHSSGKTIVSASTTEWPIRQHLYSCTDVCAAQSIGKVLAQRCLQAGLTNVYYDEQEDIASEKLKVFLDAIKSGDVELTEPATFTPEIQPGIDYDNPKGNRYAEKKRWKDDIQDRFPSLFYLVLPHQDDLPKTLGKPPHPVTLY